MPSIVLWTLLVTMSQIQNAPPPHILWEQSVDFAGRTDQARRVTHVGDFVIISGLAQTSTGAPEWALRVYTKQTGALVWAAQAPRARSTTFGTGAFAVAKNRLYIASEKDGNIPGLTRDILVRAYDIPTGQIAWEHVIDTGRDDAVAAIDATADVVAVVGVGGDPQPGDPLRGIVRAFDEDGNILLDDTTNVGLQDVSVNGQLVTVVGHGIPAQPGPFDWFIRTYRVKRDRD